MWVPCLREMIAENVLNADRRMNRGHLGRGFRGFPGFPFPCSETCRFRRSRAMIPSMTPNRDDTSEPPSAEEIAREVDDLVDECRSTCLWYLRRDYYPRTGPERWRVLDSIQKHAGRDTFRRAGRLKRWLSPRSRDGSASS